MRHSSKRFKSHRSSTLDILCKVNAEVDVRNEDTASKLMSMATFYI